MSELDEQDLQERLRDATLDVPVPVHLLHDAREGGRRRRRRARSLQISTLVAGLIVASLLVGPRLPDRDRQPVGPDPVATGSSASPTEATPQVTGVPVPSQLQRTWTTPATMGSVKTTEQLILRSDTYSLCVNGNGCLQGKVALQGNLLVFYDEAQCQTPAANHYRWTIHGNILDLTITDAPDPCYRAPDLDKFTWSRTG